MRKLFGLKSIEDKGDRLFYVEYILKEIEDNRKVKDYYIYNRNINTYSKIEDSISCKSINIDGEYVKIQLNVSLVGSYDKKEIKHTDIFIVEQGVYEEFLLLNK